MLTTTSKVFCERVTAPQRAAAASFALQREASPLEPRMQSSGDLTALLAANERPRAVVADEMPPDRDGRFTLGEALQNLGHGLAHPLSELAEGMRDHPVRTLLITAVKLASFAIASPLVAAYHLFEKVLSFGRIGMGLIGVVNNLVKGRPDDAERAFGDGGEGLAHLAVHELAEHVIGKTSLAGALKSAWKATLSFLRGR